MKRFVHLPLVALLVTATACDQSPTDVILEGARAGHLDDGSNPNNHHNDLKPTLASATAAYEGTTVDEGTNLTIAWNAASGIATTVTQRTFYRYALECSGLGCVSISETDVALTTTSFTTGALTPGTYVARVRGLGGPNANSTNHGSVWVTVAFSVGSSTPVPQNQTVTFGAAPSATYGDPHIDISSWASASSPITYSSLSPAVCAVNGVEVEIKAAGTCSVRADAEANVFFNAAWEVGNIEIAKKALTITADNASKVYGEANPAIFDWTPSGFAYGETWGTSGITGAPALTTTAGSHSDVGPYDIDVTVGSLSSGNYDFPAANLVGGTLTITPRPIRVVADNRQMVLGGSLPTFTVQYLGTGVPASGFAAGESESDLGTSGLSFMPTTAPSGIGQYPIVPSGLGWSNYQISYESGWLTVIYDFNGFLRPIEMDRLNRVKAGSAVPIKFSLNGDFGLDILSSGLGAARSRSVACDATTGDNPMTDIVTAGQSSLQYDALTQQYTYVWKTDKSWTGCRQLVITLEDGTTHQATFSFTK